jgi:aminoglycoside phosphotransferase (APT) family kinase protein
MIAQRAEVLKQHRFDVGALERYLRAHVPGFAGPLEVRQFRGGQSNPTYHLTAGAREYVPPASRPASCCPPRTPWNASTA